MMSVEQSVEWELAGETEVCTWRTSAPVPTLSTTNPTWPDLGSKPAWTMERPLLLATGCSARLEPSWRMVRACLRFSCVSYSIVLRTDVILFPSASTGQSLRIIMIATYSNFFSQLRNNHAWIAQNRRYDVECLMVELIVCESPGSSVRVVLDGIGWASREVVGQVGRESHRTATTGHLVLLRQQTLLFIASHCGEDQQTLLPWLRAGAFYSNTSSGNQKY
jgi:hypothetical protein